MIKNPPANTGDTGSIPDLGRPHVHHSLWILCATMTEITPESLCFTAREASTMRSPHITTKSILTTTESPCSNKSPLQPEKNRSRTRQRGLCLLPLFCIGRSSQWFKGRQGKHIQIDKEVKLALLADGMIPVYRKSSKIHKRITRTNKWI